MKQKLYNLTNPQKSIWYTEQFYKGSCLNNIIGNTFIDELIDFDLLKKAIYEFVKNNDGFRMHLIYDENGDIKQYLSNFNYFKIDLIDLKDKSELELIENKMANTPFSLIDQDLFCFKMYRFPSGNGGIILLAHHLIYDAYSASLAASKIVNTYSSLKEGLSSNQEPTSYIDFINSENTYLNSDKFKKDKEFWNNLFKTIPEIATIPYAHAEGETSCAAKRLSFTLSKDKMNKINEFCSTNKISNFNFFMGLYAIYIGRVSNLEDFVLGTPILNRSNFKEKNTPGMFISTMPFRFDLSKEQSFIDFVKDIAGNAFTMFRHQKYPYQYMLDEIRKNNPNQPNLYDILISYQNAKLDHKLNTIPYDVTWAFNNNVADSLQIHLADMNDEGILNISYDYRIHKYSESDITSIHERVLFMIDQVIKNKSILLKNIDIVTPEEKNTILNKFNDTYLKYDENKTIVDFFEEQVEKTPNNIALVCNHQTMTYSELNKKVNSLAHFLRNKGIKNNDIIGVMVNRSFEMIISILAVLKSGGAYIPIDPEYPEERVAYTLNNSNCSILLSEKSLQEKLNKVNFKGHTILVDLTDNDIYVANHENPIKITKPNDLSYLIYTSGSTGLPKGVMLTHKNMSNFYNSMINKIDYLKDGKYHSIASITTVSFDIFAFETIVSLARGLRLFLTNNSEQKMTLKIEKLLLDYNIEIIQTTPSIMNFHLENASINGFSRLKYIMLAGEQLPIELVNKIHEVSPSCVVYNGYGPSETTIFSTVRDVTSLDKITIGVPIHNTQIYILDNNLSILPIGVPGELYIAGDGVGKGYLNNAEMTSQRYIKNPFLKKSIMYKTGDVGIWLENGEILCKGRTDNQVKLRGLRIELGEIETKINNFDKLNNIKSCVIVKNVDGKDTLAAFISSTRPIDKNMLQKYLLEYLPTYMMPNSFTFLDKLPFTPNGKIDRKALKNYEVETTLVDNTISPARNNTEQIIINSIKKKLSLEQFGIDDNIFNYGADSLSLINILTDLFQYNINIKVSDFYKYPTIRQLSDCLLSNSSSYSGEQKKLDKYELSRLNEFVTGFSSNTDSIKLDSPKTIFLTGVTGFLGIHILVDLLQNKKLINKIYCSIRKNDDRTVEQRLFDHIHFYFGDKYDSLIKDYVICVDSDISKPMLSIQPNMLNILKDNVDCVIHSAANVKHYGSYEDSEKTNVEGTKHIIDFCLYINSSLHYISTMTISGNYLLEQENNNTIFNENTFYKKQSFDDNVYAKSKLIAEGYVINAIEKGLDCTIYRIGDLTGRYLDGHFQKNINDNSIYTRLKSLLEIGEIPDTIINNYLEFTPVEYASKAITSIIWSNNCMNRIYHIYNPNMIKVCDFLEILKKLNINMKVISMDEFLSNLENLSSSDKTQGKIMGIINDFTGEKDLVYNHIIKTDNSITCKYLSKLGFSWPILDLKYFEKLINYMISVGFININIERN